MMPPFGSKIDMEYAQTFWFQKQKQAGGGLKYAPLKAMSPMYPGQTHERFITK